MKNLKNILLLSPCLLLMSFASFNDSVVCDIKADVARSTIDKHFRGALSESTLDAIRDDVYKGCIADEKKKEDLKPE